MIEAKEIAEIAYGLVRQMSDRIHMSWEDDRAHFLREMQRLHEQSRKERGTQKHLKRQINALVTKMEQYFPDQQVQQRSEKDILDNTFELDTQCANAERKVDMMEKDNNENQKLRLPQERSNSSPLSILCPQGDLAVTKVTDVGKISISGSSASDRYPKTSSTMIIDSKNSSAKVDSHLQPSAEGQRFSCGHTRTSGDFKYSETARGKREREYLKGFSCAECDGYYRALEQQGLHVNRSPSPSKKKSRVKRTDEHKGGHLSLYGQQVANDSPTNMVQLHSRHRNKSTPPSTPEGFWDLTVLTPEDWKKLDKSKK